ncbi:hypothetical protein [Myxosarcina sp. GI1]|nr:hypothetical protein [Myxosarcina sp. GI1]
MAHKDVSNIISYWHAYYRTIFSSTILAAYWFFSITIARSKENRGCDG